MLQLFASGCGLFGFAYQLLKLASEQLALSIFAGDDLRFLCYFDFERGILLLVGVVLLEQSFEGGDLFVFFGDGGLHFGDQLPLLLYFVDVVLLVLEF